MKLIKTIKEELGEVNLKDEEIEKTKEKILNLKAPKHIKDRLNRELKRYENLSMVSPEVSIVKNYIDWLLDIPWENETKDTVDLKKVRKTLDESHFGLEKVKTRIIEFLAVKQMTHELRGPIICLVGPPGVGKTSLAFSIAKSINRNFVKISVGGINDEAEIIGHRKTYIGASPEKVETTVTKPIEQTVFNGHGQRRILSQWKNSCNKRVEYGCYHRLFHEVNRGCHERG